MRPTLPIALRFDTLRRFPFCLGLVFAASLLRVASAGAASERPASTAPVGTGAIEGRVKNASTGAYLNNARVAVPGTTLLAFTDESGTFRLAGVAAGRVTLQVFYTGLDPQAAGVTVAAGQTVERNVDLTSVARYGDDARVVKLDSYKVASSRETDIEAIAINEQRFAPNLKNVISTETLGDPLGGSMGDFLRFLPGVVAAYGALETEGVLIREFPSNLSVVSFDGVQLAGANPSGERDFNPSRVGVNSVSRVEVTKVPLPSTPADTMSGSINLVSKSAFERSTAEFKYRAGISSNQQSFAFKRTPAASNEKTTKVFPDLNFDATLPINKRLGLVITARSYQVGNRTSLYLNLRNATNEIQREDAYGSQTPSYAREFYHGKFGRAFTLGVEGAF